VWMRVAKSIVKFLARLSDDLNVANNSVLDQNTLTELVLADAMSKLFDAAYGIQDMKNIQTIILHTRLNELEVALNIRSYERIQ